MLPAATTSDSTDISLTASEDQDESTTFGRIFKNKKFIIDHEREFDTSDISELGGVLVTNSDKGIPDYAVVPINGGNISVAATHIVTDLWVTDCIMQELLISELQYYHLPYSVAPNCEIFQGLVITLSGQSAPEKRYLSQLITDLGGRQQNFISNLISTHLISDDETAPMFTAAMKWGMIIVNKAWILRCAAEGGRWVDEGDFLAGPCRELFSRMTIEQIIAPIAKKLIAISEIQTTSRVREAPEASDKELEKAAATNQDTNSRPEVEQMINYLREVTCFLESL